jgi:hypothetical protein
MQVSYNARDCLSRCVDLQLRYKRWGKELALGELMRLAVLEEPSQATVTALCRLLFKSDAGKPLRPPALGEPRFLGDTSKNDWPLTPIHLYKNVPFFVVGGWSVAGLPEQATWYLAHCMLDGVWNDHPYAIIDQAQLEAVAHDFIENGPWVRPLRAEEQAFLLSQVNAQERPIVNNHPAQAS